MPGFELIGTGHYVPGPPVTNADLSRVMDTSDEWIYQRSGIKQRHYCPSGMGVSDLAFEASKRAIEAAGIRASDIDYIIFCTMTPDYIFPGSGAILGSRLGTMAPAMDLRQQCAAMIFGLQTIDGLIKTGAAKTILFVGAEAHAGFMPWDDWSVLEPGSTKRLEGEARKRANEHRALAILFGDGAGAMIFRATDRDAGLVGVDLHTDGGAAKMLYVPGGGFRQRPYWNREMFESYAFTPLMDGRELFKYAVTRLPESARALLKKTGHSLEQVDWFLAHQANQRINEYIRKGLGVPESKMPMNIERFGNTSAGTIPILVDELTREKKLKRGELDMVLALGAGIHWGCALVRW